MEELITFELSRIAKEKGFNYPTSKYFEHSLTERVDEEDGKSGPFGWGKGELTTQSSYFINNHKDIDFSNKSWYQCSRPTQSLLQRWLREVHDIHLVPCPHHKCLSYGCDVYHYTKENETGYTPIEMSSSNSYEEALEKGLQEALKLIKI